MSDIPYICGFCSTHFQS